MTTAVTKAPSLIDGHDAATAKQLLKFYTDAQTGMRRVIALGLFAWEVKEQKLKHGQFGAWLATHCPKLVTTDTTTGKAKPSRALQSYMELTKGVLEAEGYTIEKYLAHISNAHAMRICQGGKYLLLPDKKLPEEARELKAKICDLVDGKTKRQLFAEFKQAEEDETGEVKVKRGRAKGEGGASKQQRENAQQFAESARIEAIELQAIETKDWLMEVSDDKHLGLIPDDTRRQLLEALDTAAGYLRRFKKAVI